MVAKFGKNKKQSNNSLIVPFLLAGLIFSVIGFLVVSNYRISQKRAKMNVQIDYLKEQIRILEERKRELQVQGFQAAGEAFLEKEARERFNLKKPGEEAVVVLPPEKEKISVTSSKKWWDPFSW